MIIQVKGTQLQKLVKHRIVMIKNQPHWRLQSGEQTHLIPVCETITYLGTKISLKEGSDPTLDFRLAEAAAKTSSLKKSIRSRKGLSRFHRVRVWRTCVVSSAMYGLITVQFNSFMVAKLRAWFHRQLRATVHMPAHLTKVSNMALRTQYDLQDPITVLEQSLEQKLQQLQQNQGDPAIRGPGIVEYWQQLRTQLQKAAYTPSSPTLLEAPTNEQHACPTCGLYYPTKKALRQHQALRHGQIQADRLAIEYKPEQHSVGGMPQCKHCLMKLYNWQALKGHIMQNVCGWFRPNTAEDKQEAEGEEAACTPAGLAADDTQPPTNSAARKPPSSQPGMRPSAPGTDEHLPLLQQQTVLQHLDTPEGLLTQADIHSNHLMQHCGFCQRWIAEPGMIKTNILRMHKDLAQLLNAELHAACARFKHLLRRDQACRWCGRTVHGTDRHCSQCPVLFQLVLAQRRRQAASATPSTLTMPSIWPTPQPEMQLSIAACLAKPGDESAYQRLQSMAIVARSHCLQCGEPVQDIQTWKRHMKTCHPEQGKTLDALGNSDTLLSASLVRPCPWCAAHFQKSIKEHRKKCLPLLQLCLRHERTVDAAGTRAAACPSLGPQLSAGGHANPDAAEQCSPLKDASEPAAQDQKRTGQGQTVSEQVGKRAGRREHGRRTVDGSRSARRGHDPAHLEGTDQSCDPTRTATNLARSGPQLRVLSGNGQPRPAWNANSG